MKNVMGASSFALCRFREEMSARPDFVDELLEMGTALSDSLQVRRFGDLGKDFRVCGQPYFG